jgi:HD-like signal output (HDOD) protein
MASTHTTARLRVQPAIANKVIDLLIHSDSGLTDLVQADPGLCAVVIRAANSAHLGLSRRVGGVRQAMVLLGQDAATALAVARTSDLVFDGDDTTLPPSWFWPHAVASATAAAGLATGTGVNPEHAYTAGLLQNLGVLIDDRHQPDHAEIGSDLLGRWNFPETIVNAVLNHHRTIDELVAPLDRVVVAARTWAAASGVGDGRPVAALRDVLRMLDVTRSQSKTIDIDVEHALANLVHLAGAR